MSQTTELARAAINRADEIIITLEERDDLPPVIMLAWPAQPSVATPYKFESVASKVANAMAIAAVRLSQIRRERKL